MAKSSNKCRICRQRPKHPDLPTRLLQFGYRKVGGRRAEINQAWQWWSEMQLPEHSPSSRPGPEDIPARCPVEVDSNCDVGPWLKIRSQIPRINAQSLRGSSIRDITQVLPWEGMALKTGKAIQAARLTEQEA